VIVGRSLTEATAPAHAKTNPRVRAATIALTVIVIASLIAASVFHVFLGQ
jgi:hypothetical protein